MSSSTVKSSTLRRRRAISQYTGTVIKKIKETWDTHTLHFKLDGPFDFKPGQFVMVKPTINGKTINRAYSISSPPTIKDYIALTVRLGGTYTVSKYLNEEIKVGDQLPIRGPYGKFYWEDGMSDTIFMIAAGSGITPFRSITQYVIHKKLDVRMKVLYSCRYVKEIIFYDMWREYDKKYPNLDVVLTVTREKPENWEGSLGRVDLNLLQKEIKGFEEGLFYICGAPAFVESMMNLLKEAGMTEDKIKHEDW